MAIQTSPISPETMSTAVAALLKWLSHHPPPPSGDFIYLILALNSIPHSGRHRSFSLPLPHSLFSSSICLITNEPNNPLLNSSPIKFSLVLTLSELKSLYPSPESKQELASSHDLFFTDKRIVSWLPRILGDPFYGKKKKNKEPIVINFANPSWHNKVSEILKSTKFEMKGGHCNGIKVAMLKMERKEILGNVEMAVQKAVECVPKKWRNVRSIHLKSTESVALPLYESKEEEDGNGDVHLEEKEKGMKKRKAVEKKSQDGGLKMVKKVKN
ncbi:hypothetical protein LUZ60_013346 [Juncus effusus]|nr:hypothetical protein LUZ60_013346 [Juncus effusus]